MPEHPHKQTKRRALDSAHRCTPSVYQRHALAWDRARSRSLGETPWIERLIADVSPSSDALDLGCGGGEPIASLLVERGLKVTGVDISAPLVSLCRERFPAHRWIEADMRRVAFEHQFAAIVGWDSFFHLSPGEQRALLPRLTAALRLGGRLLLTVGPEAGEALGEVAGEPVYHSSLAPEEYAELLHKAGMCDVLVTFNAPGTAGRTVLLATK